MWDLLIVGTGPAGVSAALTARARGLSFLWFGSRRLSDKVEKAERILNLPRPAPGDRPGAAGRFSAAGG